MKKLNFLAIFLMALISASALINSTFAMPPTTTTSATATPSSCVCQNSKDVYVAAQKGCLSCLEELINKDNVNTPDTHGRTPLHLAVLAKNYKTCEFLLSKNANVDAKIAAILTPLHIAVANGCKDIC